MSSQSRLLENTARKAGADLFPGVDRYGDHPTVVGMHDLTMAGLAAARLDEAGGLQSANQFTPRHRSITYR